MKWPCFALLMLCASTALAEPQALPEQPLWAEGAPGAQGTTDADVPVIFPYLPEGATDATPAVIVCPGGGYAGLAMDYEGHEVAQWLAKNGIAGFVLRYRHAPGYHHPTPLMDAQRALRTVRHRAKEWNIATDKVGILGFSAGGHLTASTAALHEEDIPKGSDAIDQESARPDFACPVYAVISMEEPYGHMGSRKNLLGENPDPALVKLVCLEQQVDAETPPCFIVHTQQDQAVPVENALLFFEALQKVKVPAELHIFTRGKHGLGMGRGDKAFEAWPGLLLEWLRVQGVLPEAAP